jgi:hypothetical protein
MLSRRRFLGYLGLAPVVATAGAVAVTQAGAGTWYRKLLARLAPPEPWRTQHTTYALGFKVEQGLLNDDQHRLFIEAMQRDLAKATRLCQDRMAQSILDDSFTGSAIVKHHWSA